MKRIVRISTAVARDTNEQIFAWFEAQPLYVQNYCIQVLDYFERMHPYRRLNLWCYTDKQLEYILRLFTLFFRRHPRASEYELDSTEGYIARRFPKNE